MRHATRLTAAVILVGCLASAGRTEPAGTVPGGQIPADRRLEPLKTLDSYFPFHPPQTREAWQRRADQLRRRLLVAQGLWPLPDKTPLGAVIHGRIEQDDYTVEKVYFESMPGFFVTGNLYRPRNGSGRRPGVLCPHGHWRDGRFHDAGSDEARRQIAAGGERFEAAGRSPLQARCVHLARMGCVVFHYDMIGYADSTQLSRELAHAFSKVRPEMDTPQDWGLFSPQAEAHLQSVMGLQTFSSIRALDFLADLPDVDRKRLAVTGASGGGTQTFMLCAVDPRPAVAMPCVMVSTAMQGGCTCENCALLRVDSGNVEFAALFAPKPLGLTAANDWTKEMQTKGFPELQQLYALLGVPDRVMLAANLQFGHNYNGVSRKAMYEWFNRHLDLGADLSAGTTERDFKFLARQQLSVWDDDHPRPPGGLQFERQLLRRWTEGTARQLAALVPHDQESPRDQESLKEFHNVVGRGVDEVIGRGMPDAADLEFKETIKQQFDSHLQIGGRLRNKPLGEELPILCLYPERRSGQVVVWIDPAGKSGLFAASGEITPAVRRLLDEGVSVVGVDLLYQGEFLADGKPLQSAPWVPHARPAACYTYGYNHALFARRVHDILTVVAFVRQHDRGTSAVDLVGLAGAGPWVAAARTQLRQVVRRAAVDTGGFRFGKLTDVRDVDFLPGGALYFDLPGMLALSAPGAHWLAGEQSVPEIVRAAYRAAAAEDRLVVPSGPAERRADEAVAWLLEKPR